MRQQHIKSDYTGTRKGIPDPSRVHSNDLWRRPSTELKPVATPSGSVRNDRCNKSRSPKANAPSATRASRHTPYASAPRTVATCIHPSPSRSARGGGAERTQGMPAKGRVSGREFGRRRTLDAKASRLRHQDVQNYPMGSDRAQPTSRDPGPRSGNAGSDRTRKASSSSTSRTNRQRLMDCDPARRVAIHFNGNDTTPAPPP